VKFWRDESIAVCFGLVQVSVQLPTNTPTTKELKSLFSIQETETERGTKGREGMRQK